MKTYALIHSGAIIEIIAPLVYDVESPDWVEGDPSRIGTEIPIEMRYVPEFVANMVDITEMDPAPQYGWVWNGEGFTPYVPPPPTEAEILAAQSLKLQRAIQLAAAQKTALTERISVINDAIDFEEATPEEIAELLVRQAQLTEWKRYAILLGRVTSQQGWPPEAEWPVQPSEGMDLTVSAVAPGSGQLQ